MKLKDNEIAKVSVVSLCRLFGVSRQAFYQREDDRQKGNAQALLVLDLVLAFRREIPGLGTRKMHLLLRDSLAESGINRTDFYDLNKGGHILFVIISVFSDAAVPRRDENT